MSSNIDLSAFPILRLDQISIIDSNCLENSLKEVEKLIQNDENENPAIYRYLVKQFDQIKQELASREALQRVQNLLKGLEDPLNRKDEIVIDSQTPRERIQKPKAQVKDNRPAFALPSNANELSASSSLSIKSSYAPSTQLEFGKLRKESSKLVPSAEVSSEKTLPSSSMLSETTLQSRSFSNVKPNSDHIPLSSNEGNSLQDESDQGGHQTPRSTASGHSNRSSRRSQQNDPDKQPSKRSLEVIYKNFGNEFIVAATEKKKRFYPAKKNLEPIEEVKNRERLERRKQAMQRLLQRREEREKQMQILREKKRQERVEEKKREAAALKEKGTSSDPHIESSDSESVSGGDEEYEKIEISDRMVEAVQEIITDNQPILGDLAREGVEPESAPSAEKSEFNHEKDPAQTTPNSSDLPSTISVSEPLVSSKSKAIIGKKENERSVSKKEVKQKSLLDSKSSSSIRKASNEVKPDHKEAEKRRNTVSLPVQSKVAVRSEKAAPKIISSSENANVFTEKTSAEEDRGETNISGDLEAKNMAALTTIRRLKELKINRSKLAADKLEPQNFVPQPGIIDKDNEEEQVPQSVENPCNNTEGSIQSDGTPHNIAVEEKEKIIIPSLTIPNVQIEENVEQNVEEDEQNVEDDEPNNDEDCSDDLFVYDGACFISNFEAEQLPGLSAWKLEKVTHGHHDWKIDLTNYISDNSSSRSEFFEYQSSKRKSIPSGLILIAIECQDILFGYTNINDNEMFLAEWIQKIQEFDAKTSQYDAEEEKLLFTNQWICGNGYLICKKLETLIKDVFTKLSSTILPAKPVLDQSAPLTERRLLLSRESVVARLRIELEVAQKSDNAVSSQIIVMELNDRIEGIGIELQEKEPLQKDEEILIDSSGFLEIEKCRGRSISEATETAPSNMNLENENLTASSTATENSENQSKDENQSSAVSSLINSKEPVGKGRRPSKGVPLNVPKSLIPKKAAPSSASSTGINLIEYYPNFGMLFPVAYHRLGSRDDSSSAARILIESMHIQAKLYDEWMEVMRDYSTVFCSDDTVDNVQAVERSNEVYQGNSRTLHFRVKSSRSEVTNIVTDVLSNELKDWIQLPTGLGLGLSWNLLWTWSKPHINKEHLVIWQKINHFDDSKQLTRKDLLKKNIQRFTDMKDNKYANEFEIMPQTFLLPHEYTQFVASFKEFESFTSLPSTAVAPAQSTGGTAVGLEDRTATIQSSKSIPLAPTTNDGTFHNYWILKPVGLSRGRGINLIKSLNEVVYSQSSVIQKYIERPLCLNHYKFDLRLFIVVTSFKPLEAFIYRDGFARVSTHQYSLHPNDTNNKFIHLTNSSIQKQNANGPTEDNPINDKEDDPDAGGSKIALLGNNGLWKRLQQYGGGGGAGGGRVINVEELWNDICLLIIKSLVAVDDKMIFQPNCFELFGYDILIDETLRPWLLEVNASPSLARENALDKRIKNAMLKDLVILLDIAPFDRAALSRIIQKRLSQMNKNRYLMGKNDAELEKDLKEILGDYIPRRYGELPKQMGNFERLAPETGPYQTVMKLKKKIIRTVDDQN